MFCIVDGICRDIDLVSSDKGDDDDDNPKGYTITAKVENGRDYNSMISEVRVMAYIPTYDDFQELASGSYSNGGLK